MPQYIKRQPQPETTRCHDCGAWRGVPYYRWPTSPTTITPERTLLLADETERAKWSPLGPPTVVTDGRCQDCNGASGVKRGAA